jgi:hypothetical protein
MRRNAGYFAGGRRFTMNKPLRSVSARMCQRRCLRCGSTLVSDQARPTVTLSANPLLWLEDGPARSRKVVRWGIMVTHGAIGPPPSRVHGRRGRRPTLQARRIGPARKDPEPRMRRPEDRCFRCVSRLFRAVDDSAEGDRAPYRTARRAGLYCRKLRDPRRAGPACEILGAAGSPGMPGNSVCAAARTPRRLDGLERATVAISQFRPRPPPGRDTDPAACSQRQLRWTSVESSPQIFTHL